MRIKNGLIFDEDAGFVRRDLYTEGQRLAAADSGGETVEAGGCYVIPGLTDLHFHGCKGHDFSDGDPEGLAAIAQYQLSRGVTQICPAGMTLPEEQLLRICRVAARHKAAGRGGAELCGIHLEGPFLSHAKKGAQNSDWLHAPDLELLHRLISAAEGLVKLVTIAPEEPGALAFIEAAARELTVCLGHTTADYDTALRAFSAGARQVTHLFNAMPPLNHRAPGVIGAALDSPDCMAELICDGVHIHPAVVRAAFKMFGARRMLLVSDTMRAAGMPDGQYTLGGQAVTVRGNEATLSDGILAGSVTDLMSCMQLSVSMGIPLADAVTAAAVNPAKVLGIYGRVGSLEPGKLANFCILDESLTLKAVFFRGERVPV